MTTGNDINLDGYERLEFLRNNRGVFLVKENKSYRVNDDGSVSGFGEECVIRDRTWPDFWAVYVRK